MLQRRERHIYGLVRRVDFRSGGKRQGQNHRRLLHRERLGHPILGPGAAHDRAQFKFIGDLLDAQEVEFVLRFKQRRLLALDYRRQRRERGVGLRSLEADEFLVGVGLSRGRLPARIVQRLSDQRDRPHQ